MSILIFAVILGTLVLVHEFGHFIVAKRFGVRVDEFGIGFPPRLFAFRKGETEYSLNLIPLGGFVKIFGEDPEDTLSPENKERSFSSKSKWTQAAILVAGVFFNFVFAWFLLSINFISGVDVPVTYREGVVNARLMVTYIVPQSPAEAAGIHAGDVILFLEEGGRALQDITPEDVSNFIASSKGEITFLYKRNEETKTVVISPTDGILPEKKAIGISMDLVGTIKLPIHEAVIEGAKTTSQLIYATTLGLFTFFDSVFRGTGDFSQISGPVGIVSMVDDVSQLGFLHIISFAALISINLGVINLLPFPALDGGRLFFIFIEAIIRRPIKPVFVRTAHGLGFVLLILLMLVVTFNDIVRLF